MEHLKAYQNRHTTSLVIIKDKARSEVLTFPQAKASIVVKGIIWN